LIKRLPRQRGFRNRFRVEYQVVNLKALERFEPGAEVSPAEMLREGLVRNLNTPVKVLGEGDISKALSVKADKFSASAREKIAAAGGSAEETHAAATSG
jgi:large subunit ribosomal protein L15